MAVNIYQPHLLILSEDDAYRDLANGFVGHSAVVSNKIQIDQPAGGWLKLLDKFSKSYIRGVQKNRHRYVLLLLDLDGDSKRYSEKIRQEILKIPQDIEGRVFALSSHNEAEDIKKDLGAGHFEAIGEKLAESCYQSEYDSSDTPWLCSQLRHNRNELSRLAAVVRPFLFIE